MTAALEARRRAPPPAARSLRRLTPACPGTSTLHGGWRKTQPRPPLATQQALWVRERQQLQPGTTRQAGASLTWALSVHAPPHTLTPTAPSMPWRSREG